MKWWKDWRGQKKDTRLAPRKGSLGRATESPQVADAGNAAAAATDYLAYTNIYLQQMLAYTNIYLQQMPMYTIYDAYGRPVEGMKPVPPLRLPTSTRTSAIIAHRSWRLWEDEGVPTLHSIAIDQYGWPGPIVATDKPADRVSPEMTESHGFYSFREPGGIERTYRNNEDVVVVGEVELFGKVVVHEVGYRAEKVRIRKLGIVPCVAMHSTSIVGERIMYVTDHERATYKQCGCPVCTIRNPKVKEQTRPMEELVRLLGNKYDCDVELLSTRKELTQPTKEP